MKEIAERAGVSISSVSLVLNNRDKGRVAPRTAARVRALARKMRYHPNLLARSLQTSSTRILGFISENVATTPYASRLILGAQDAADECGYALLSANVDSGRFDDASSDNLGRVMDVFYQYGVDGFLYAKMSNCIFDPPAPADKPMVLVDCSDRGHRIPSIEPDEFLIGYDATCRLARAGCRKIAYLGFPDPTVAQVRRRAGYRQALKDAGLPYDSALDLKIGENSEALKAVDALVERKSPDGFFCFNDARALHVYLAAAGRNLKIGVDISVIGVDNHRMFSQTLSPRLTTVELPHYEMGYWAVNRLVQEMEGEPIRLPQEKGWASLPDLESAPPALIHCRLIEKESVKGGRRDETPLR